MNKLIILLILLSIYSSSVLADYKPSVSDEKTIETITVKPNGSNVTEYENITLIETEKGVDSDSQQDIEYNSKTESVQVLEAYTLQADGEKIKVPKDGIRTTDDPISNGAPMFSETKHKVVIFPDVKVGSRLYIRYRNIEHTPQFKGHFFMAHFFSPHFIYRNFEINLIVSNKIPVQVDSKGLLGSFVKELNGQKFYHYAFKQEVALPPEPGQIDIEDYAPYFKLQRSSRYWYSLPKRG